MTLLLLLAGVAASMLVRDGNSTVAPAPVLPPRRAQLAAAYGRLPLSFEPNAGQADPQVKFLARGQGYALFLTRDEAVLELRGSEARGRGSARVPSRPAPHSSLVTRHFPRTTGSILAMKLVGANPNAPVSGLDDLPGKTNYLLGNDPRLWRTGIPNYARVLYRDVYPGVDLVYYGHQGRLEYDFVVAPGADPNIIRLDLAPGFRPASASAALKGGVTRACHDGPLRIAPNGDLVVEISGDELRFHKPVVYQPWRTPPAGRSPSVGAGPNPERRSPITCHYQLAHHQVMFKVDAYDHARPLVIDPALTYSTYLGGGGADIASAIAIDSSGNAYITGSTQSTKFPTASPFQANSGAKSDAFVTKLSPAGSTLVYSTYLGGNSSDQGNGIAVDSSGNVYVAGSTTSANFPTTSGAFRTTYGGASDAFVAKLNPTGAALVYSTFLGASGADFGQAIALDSSGNAYVTGSTASSGFPTATPLQSGLAGGFDAFVAKLNSGGSALTYSTYLGGAANDSGQGIAVDAAGEAFVTGYTLSANFPTAAAFQRSSGGAGDAFVSKLNAAGSALVYSTYLGGSGLDRGFGIALDSAGAAYVTGDTASTNFPVTAGAFQALNAGNGDAFVAKLSAAGTLAYSTFLGGADADRGLGVAVDRSLNAYVTGVTQSSDFPVVEALQPALGGGDCGASPCSDAFVAKLNAQGAALDYSTYLGGNGADFGDAVAVDASGNAYVAGATASPNFPAVAPGFQPVYAGTSGLSNAFVAKLNAAGGAALAASPQSLTFASQGTGSTSASQIVTVTDAGSASLALHSLTPSAGFAVDSAGTTCAAGAALAAGASCTVAVTFHPVATGAATGTLTITDGAPGSPHVIALSGTGATPAPAVTLLDSAGAVVTSLTFPTESVGSHSPAQSVTVENSGSAALTITKIAATGDYTETNGCGTSLGVGAKCAIGITFAPTGSGTRAGSLTVTDNASGSPQTVALNGTAAAVFTLSATKTSQTIAVGVTSATFTVALAAPKSFTTSLAFSCTNNLSATCSFNPATITGGKTTVLTISGLSGSTPNPFTFDVMASNGVTGTTLQTAVLPLTVVFEDYTVAATPALAQVVAGKSANFTVTVAPTNSFNQTVTLSCSNQPPQTTCAFSPASVTPNGAAAASSTMTVQTTAPTVSSRFVPRQPRRPNWPSGVTLILLAFAALLTVTRTPPVGARGTRRSRMTLAMAALLVVVWAGCDTNTGFNVIGPSPLRGTIPGNYILVVTGTLGTSTTPTGSSTTTAAVTRSTTVNLSVSQ